MIIALCCYQRTNIFMIWTNVHSGVNLGHFKGAHLEPNEHTGWNWHANLGDPGTAYLKLHPCDANDIILGIYDKIGIYLCQKYLLKIYFLYLYSLQNVGLVFFFYCHFHEILTWISLHVWSGFFGSTCVMPGFDIQNSKKCLGQPSCFSLDLACTELNEAIIKQVLVNSLGPSNAIWWQKTGSTLAQVMACCLTAPSHYLNQCWLIISEVQWHSYQGNFTRDASAIIH